MDSITGKTKITYIDPDFLAWLSDTSGVNFTTYYLKYQTERLAKISYCCDAMEYCRMRQKNPDPTEHHVNPSGWMSGELDWLEELHLLLYDLDRVDFHLPNHND